MVSLSSERGFALPLTILVVTVMTMLIAAAHVRVRADRIIAESSGATVTAFAVAQSGLNRYFVYYDSINVRPPDGDSLRINVTDGYADVLAYKVRSPADTMEPELYIVRSTGFLIEPTRGSDPQAQRTVAQFAQWQSAAMKLSGGAIGAITAANGVQVDSVGLGRVRVYGNNQCGTAPSVPGVRVPLDTLTFPGDTTPSASDFDVLTGSPALLPQGTGLSVATDTEIDWESIVNGDFDAEYDTFRSWDSSYPTMLVTGDLTVSDAGGYGLLMVTGDLTLNGFFFSWRGIVLVGGRIVSNTMFTALRGVTVTGLNVLLGMSPLMGQMGGGIGDFHEYHECEVRNALNSLVGFVPIGNAWIDNWAVY